MKIDLSRFKVVYGDKVLNVVALQHVDLGQQQWPSDKSIAKPKFLEVIALNECGNIIVIHDEAWCFQFVPIVNGGN